MKNESQCWFLHSFQNTFRFGRMHKTGEKRICPTVFDLKEKSMDSIVRLFRWIETKKMVADILTDEKIIAEVNEIMYEKKYNGIEKGFTSKYLFFIVLD